MTVTVGSGTRRLMRTFDALAVALTLAACGSPPAPATPPAPVEPAAAPPADPDRALLEWLGTAGWELHAEHTRVFDHIARCPTLQARDEFPDCVAALSSEVEAFASRVGGAMIDPAVRGTFDDLVSNDQAWLCSERQAVALMRDRPARPRESYAAWADRLPEDVSLWEGCSELRPDTVSPAIEWANARYGYRRGTSMLMHWNWERLHEVALGTAVAERL